MRPARRYMTVLAPCVADGLEKFAPWPAACIAALRDLDLTEREIALYFRVTPRVVFLAKHCSSLQTITFNPDPPANADKGPER
jgi:hypothetical protein